MSKVPTVCEVAVFAPLRQVFDYRVPAGLNPRRGARVWVPFGTAHRVGVVVAVHGDGRGESAPELKPLDAVLDAEPLLDPAMLRLAAWSADYYQHPLGDVLAALLPTVLRRRQQLPDHGRRGWRVTAAGRAEQATLGRRAPKQRRLLDHLGEAALPEQALVELDFDWRATLRRLQARGWVEAVRLEPPAPQPATPGPTLNAEQQAAVDAVGAALGEFQAWLLWGVTGSGKTEVYLDLIARVLAAGRQALVLVPEIALTQHLLDRFRQRFGSRVGVLHSGLGERERALTWDACRRGEIGVLVGTRSAVWVGLPTLGLVVVDEEHDASYKQQDGFRYSARDVAIVRAQQAGIPVLLGSATPSLETLANAARGKYRELRLDARALAASPPAIECVDVRGLGLRGGLGDQLVEAMHAHLARGEQVMLFLNRRGYAPLLICRHCGEPRRCDRCDAFLVYHKGIDAARCHHCDRYLPMRRPASCCELPEIAPIGLGTERVEEIVAELFPGHRVCRMDRDTVRHPATLAAMLEDIAAGRVDILIGTQMVAKGLDFAAITLVGIVDADSRLYALDFRAEERLAQLLVQVAGRAGRAARAGRVLIQTHQPRHPVLRRVIDHGYGAYARAALAEREQASLPPFAAMAVLRAESPRAERPLAFLADARRLLLDGGEAVEISFPIPALMERRAGRYRALIVLSAATRGAIGRTLGPTLEALDGAARAARVRYSIDVDPQDTL
ncbi:MAG: primosomal protein N' [Gammaproteobacteria bacterium]|nr:primosomal protein N' [Gammaproteobacteria bacterium]MCP5200759.1 primosomal protein N' [Gammaproteobacteria bacterium]